MGTEHICMCLFKYIRLNFNETITLVEKNQLVSDRCLLRNILLIVFLVENSIYNNQSRKNSIRILCKSLIYTQLPFNIIKKLALFAARLK